MNIAYPANGTQKKIEIDENRLHHFYDRRMAEEVSGDALGDEFKGYVFKITGGNDAQGFPMRQGVLVAKRVKLLLRRGMPCYKARRKGEQKRKSVRGCIVGPDIAALNLTIVKRGEQDLPGITDAKTPRRLGPKRVGKIVKMFNLSKTDDVRNYVVRRQVKTKSGNRITKKPKIQRLITPAVLQRRKQIKKRVERRKKASYMKRKAYFERLTQQKAEVKETQQKVQEAVSKPAAQSQKGKAKGRKGRKK